MLAPQWSGSPIRRLSIWAAESTVPQYLLLRPNDGGNISYTLGRDRCVKFLTRRSQRRRRRRAAVSTVRLVFLQVFHTLC